MMGTHRAASRLLPTLCLVTPGTVAGAFAMWSAWRHNPQESIHTLGADSPLWAAALHPGSVDWVYWGFIGLSWGALMTLFAGAPAAYATHLALKPKEAPR